MISNKVLDKYKIVENNDFLLKIKVTVIFYETIDFVWIILYFIIELQR